MKITKATAIEAVAWLNRSAGDPCAAQHEVAVQMTAIRPYVSRDLEAVRAALNFCVSYNDDTQARRVAQLVALAADVKAVR